MNFRKLFFAILLTIVYPFPVMATGYQFITEFENEVDRCIATRLENGSHCITKAIALRLGNEKPILTPLQLQGLLDDWLNEGHIVSIMSMSTNVIIKGMMIDKTYRILSSNNAMAVLEMNLSSVDNVFYIRSFNTIIQDDKVVNAVCSDSCH